MEVCWRTNDGLPVYKMKKQRSCFHIHYYLFPIPYYLRKDVV